MRAPSRLDKVTSREVLTAFRQIGQLKAFAKYSDDDLWAAIGRHREPKAEADTSPTDLKGPEWQVFSNPNAAPHSRDLSLECGYTTASIAERIYCNDSGDAGPSARILIYTAAADSEGTLGGLAALGSPERLESLLQQALERARYCSSDPLCSEHGPLTDSSLHAAACHSCLFLPETSCERGNQFLDRAVLVPTMELTDLAFFGS